MRIENNNEVIGFYIGGLSEKNDKRGILASELTINQDNQEDSITMRKVQGQKDAIKTLVNQLTSDKKIDDDIESRRQHMRALDDEISVYQNEVAVIEGTKQKVKESFGISDDSEEQKNLELIEKQIESRKPNSAVVLSDAEKEKLAKIGPQTEYQTEMLAYDSIESEWKSRIESAKKEKMGENGIIKAIKKELLKVHPMIDAQGEAEEIKKEANSEVIAMMIDEAKNHIDEKQDEIEKAAEEKAAEEKTKEAEVAASQKEAIDKPLGTEGEATGKEMAVKMDEKIQNTGIENMSQLQKAVNNQQQIQTEIKMLVLNQKLTPEDIKGIVVDEQF